MLYNDVKKKQLANRLSLSSICVFSLSQPPPTHAMQRCGERESRIDSALERERSKSLREEVVRKRERMQGKKGG